MKDLGLSDRERILTILTSRLCAASNENRGWGDEHYLDYEVYFAPWAEPNKDDLVMARTGRPDRWKFAIYVMNLGDGDHIVRDLVSEMECRYSNEFFTPIRGLSNIELLYGNQREFYYKVLKAFERGTHRYIYRFGGLEFNGDVAAITIREAFGLTKDSEPFKVSMPWNKRTSVKSILSAMTDGGYGTRKFGGRS